MKTLSLTFVLLLSITSSTLSAIISSPGIQRKSSTKNCTFQWTVTLPLDHYTVYNLTIGSPMPLNSNAHYYERNGTVSLTISNIQMWDAGNYSLSVTAGNKTQLDSSALLFVYGRARVSINQTSSPMPATEGQTVELTCTAISTSLPAAYRPKMCYRWYLSRSRTSWEDICSGPAMLSNGDHLVHLPRYSIKNDGGTLVIESAQYSDTERIYCYGQEEGPSFIYDFDEYKVELYYRPCTTWRNPHIGIRNYVSGGLHVVSFSFGGEANPKITSYTNWTFTNASGSVQNLPPAASKASDSVFGDRYFYRSLSFNLTSAEFYGNYSITVTNSIGSITETFQLLPPGPPDSPSNFRVYYASHSEIALKWSTMWDNGPLQTVFLQVNVVGDETAVVRWNKTNDYYYTYNKSQDYTVSDNIEPETNYDAMIWSANALGTSEVVRLTIRTPKQPKLYVSAETISLNGSQAIINYKTSDGNITSLRVYCCVELTIKDSYKEFYVTDIEGQVILNNLPSGNEYVCGIVAYGGIPNEYKYFAAMVLGIRVSRARILEKSDVTIIVLSTVLALTVLTLIGCLVAFLVSKCRGNDQQNTAPKQVGKRMLLRRESCEPQRQEADEDDVDGMNVSQFDQRYSTLKEVEHLY